MYYEHRPLIPWYTYHVPRVHVQNRDLSGKYQRRKIIGRKLGELGQLQYRDTQTYWRNSWNLRARLREFQDGRISAFRIRRKEGNTGSGEKLPSLYQREDPLFPPPPIYPSSPFRPAGSKIRFILATKSPFDRFNTLQTRAAIDLIVDPLPACPVSNSARWN